MGVLVFAAGFFVGRQQPEAAALTADTSNGNGADGTAVDADGTPVQGLGGAQTIVRRSNSPFLI